MARGPCVVVTLLIGWTRNRSPIRASRCFHAQVLHACSRAWMLSFFFLASLANQVVLTNSLFVSAFRVSKSLMNHAIVKHTRPILLPIEIFFAPPRFEVAPRLSVHRHRHNEQDRTESPAAHEHGGTRSLSPLRSLEHEYTGPTRLASPRTHLILFACVLSPSLGHDCGAG